MASNPFSGGPSSRREAYLPRLNYNSLLCPDKNCKINSIFCLDYFNCPYYMLKRIELKNG